jgi:hypothetical protein
MECNTFTIHYSKLLKLINLAIIILRTDFIDSFILMRRQYILQDIVQSSLSIFLSNVIVGADDSYQC